MASASSGVVVKNTFLEVGDHKSLLERSDGWRRQMSEPVKIYTDSGDAALSESDDDNVLLGGAMPPAPLEPRGGDFAPAQPSLSPQALGSTVPVPFAEGFSDAYQEAYPEAAEDPVGAAQASGGKSPKVLLLSESIPPGKQRGGQKERERRVARDGHINQMKDNSITNKEPPWTGVTTVMMRNLPNKYTQQMLLEELQDGGFRVLHDFDFFYLPMDHNNAANLGYCFINFVETALANSFAAAFMGKKMRRFNSNKTVVVMPASVQGYERNYAYYASTRVVQAEDPQYRPLFLRPPADGAALPVPPYNHRGGGKGKGGGKGGGREKGGEKGGGRGKGGKGGGMARGGGGADFNGGMSQGAPDWMSNVMGVGMGMGPGAGAMMGAFMGAGPGMGPMPGAGAGLAAPWPGMQPAAPQATQQRRHCHACGKEVSPSHRFCAFCGADQMAAQSGPDMRADAPSFMPSVGPAGYSPALGVPEAASSPLPGQAPLDGAEPWPLGAPLRSPEVITDELDVMRGRMVLLAALRDMERREGAQGAPGAGPAREQGAGFPGMAPAPLGYSQPAGDFFSMLER